MPRIVVDEHTCEGLGMCEAMAVDYFEVQPEGLVKILDERPAPDRVEAARRRGFAGQVVLVGAEDRAPYDRPPLSKAVLASDGPAEPATLRSDLSLRAELGVDLGWGRRPPGSTPRRGWSGSVKIRCGTTPW